MSKNLTITSGSVEEDAKSASEKILQLEIELDRQSQKLSDLGTMGAVIASMLDNEQALPVVMEMALRSVGAEVGAILMEEGSGLVTRVGWGIDDVLLRSIQLETGEKICDIYNASDEAILINAPLSAKNVGVHIHNLLATPVKSRNKRHGLVIVLNKEGGGNFTAGDKETLQALSNFLAVAIENAQLLEESLEKQRIQQELIVAQQVQESILPKQSLRFPGISIGAVYVAAREVGGDFYSLIPISETEFVLIIGDVSSKGVPAALIMAASAGIINATLKHSPDMAVSDLASQLNDSLCEGIVKDKDMFATIWFGRFDLKHGRLTYCNSGHLPPLYRRSKDNEISELNIGGSIVGQFLKSDFKEGSIDFEKGDSFVLFTDGLTEAENSRRELFGRVRATQFFRQNANLEPQEFCDRLKSHVDKFARGSSDESHDDFTTLMLRIDGDHRIGSNLGQTVSSRYKFSYPSNLESENKIFVDLTESLEECQIEGRLAYAISLCVSEAFCNALIHGNKMDPEKTIILELDVNQQIVRADITDQGNGDIVKIRNRPHPSDLSETGRGIDLIERTANRLELLNISDESGLTLRMEFDRSKWDEEDEMTN